MLNIPSHEEMQIKTTLKFHFTPFRMVIIKNKQQKMLERMQGKCHTVCGKLGINM
jgi:hypothetical protein